MPQEENLQTFKPLIFRNEKEANNLVSDKKVIRIDAFSRQIRELFFIDNNKYIGTDKDKAYESSDFKNYLDSKKDSFVYIYYPWNFHLVKSVDDQDYFRLKTNRNQDLITAEEQKKLSKYNVAVLGMSVGSNIAFVLAQAGISKKILLADFDELDTTNLNRILAGVHQVGVNKAIVAARRIYEDNPFADVTALTEGVTETNLEPLLKNKEINCIVEEIDNIPFKIHIRELAIKYKVPVIMITDNGDGVVLHIERYDLGHTKIFSQDPAYFEEKISHGEMTKEQAGQVIMFDIVGGPEFVDPKMRAAGRRVIAKDLVSGAQLGSAAILGGVRATVAIKQIALGSDTRLDVRSYINPKF